MMSVLHHVLACSCVLFPPSLSPSLPQLRSLLSSTMEDYTSLFSPDDTTCLPVFKLQLCLDEGAMQFFPTLADLEAAVMFPLHTLATDTLQSFPLIQVLCWVMCSAVVWVTNPQIGCANSLTIGQSEDYM